MFHDQFLETEEEQKLWHGVYNRLAEAIEVSLGKFLEAIKAFEVKIHADGKNTHSAVQMLLYDFADSIDGVAALTRLGAAKNCAAPLRTGLEIGLAYILEVTDTYEPRSLSYEYFHHLSELKIAQKCDPTHPVGIDIRKKLEGDQYPDIYDEATFDVKAEITSWEKKLASPRYYNVKAEYDRMKKPKNWYSLWNGPKDMHALAIRLKMLSSYEALYRVFSTTVHGAGAMKRIGKRGIDGTVEIDPLRSPTNLTHIARHACHLTNGLTITVARKLVPEMASGFPTWYKESMKPAYEYINNVNIK